MEASANGSSRQFLDELRCMRDHNDLGVFRCGEYQPGNLKRLGCSERIAWRTSFPSHRARLFTVNGELEASVPKGRQNRLSLGKHRVNWIHRAR